MWDKAEILKNVVIKTKVPQEENIMEPKVGSGVKFTYTSKNLEEGYPGEIVTEAYYLLTSDNELYFYWKAWLTKDQDC